MERSGDPGVGGSGGPVGVALGVAAWLFLYDPHYSGAFAVPEEPIVFAHRGFGNHGPDNSLHGVEQAFEVGVDGVDVDGQPTVDGHLVIFHDLSVDRLTSGTGRVDALTLEQMLALDLGPSSIRRSPGPSCTPSRPSSRPLPTRGP